MSIATKNKTSVKPTSYFFTEGVKELELHPTIKAGLLYVAQNNVDHPFLIFIPAEKGATLHNEVGEVISDTNIPIPTKMYVTVSHYDDCVSMTLLLPEEY